MSRFENHQFEQRQNNQDLLDHTTILQPLCDNAIDTASGTESCSASNKQEKSHLYAYRICNTKRKNLSTFLPLGGKFKHPRSVRCYGFTTEAVTHAVTHNTAVENDTNYIKTTTRLNPTCLPIIAPGPYSNYNNVRIAKIRMIEQNDFESHSFELKKDSSHHGTLYFETS